MSGDKMRLVEPSGSTAGKIPSDEIARSRTVVASKCAKVVACLLYTSHPHRNSHAAGTIAGIFTEVVQHIARNGRNAEQVLIGFSGQAHHEVQLNAVISGAEGDTTGVLQIFFAQIFVDDIAQKMCIRDRLKAPRQLSPCRWP